MKKLFVGLMILGASYANAQFSIDGSVKGSYNSTWLFNKNISDLGMEQDYAMGWGSNVGIGASVYYGAIGFGVEFMSGTHTGGYTGDFLGKYNSNVKLNMTQIPLLLKLKSENGAYIELGAAVHNISKATYTLDYTDSDLFDRESDESSRYSNSFTSAVLGFGANVKIVKAIPLSLNLGVRLQYGFSDAKGVDALGLDLSNKLLYPTYEKTNAVSGGLVFGVSYTFEAK